MFLVFPNLISIHDLSVDPYLVNKAIYTVFIEEHMLYLISLLKSEEIIKNMEVIHVYTNDFIYNSISEYWEKKINLKEKRKTLIKYNKHAIYEYCCYFVLIIVFMWICFFYVLCLMVKNISK